MKEHHNAYILINEVERYSMDSASDYIQCISSVSDNIFQIKIDEMSGDDDFHLGLIISGLIVLLLGAIYLLSRIWLSE